ncbi:hypothetical protein M8C21_019566 [Ambrosia artemisiifolia]|uniref:NLP1-9 GAF domain-containing protein n=1 Tax=Ambrosia artemisiifolia TaxID=4212 RepID=A0AAD5GF45_AMBAR|nr:hypothetical protein M8C21_019566 [Ambrosia artemisiifolia]
MEGEIKIYSKMVENRWPKADLGRTANWSNGRAQATSDVRINQKILFTFHNVKSLPLERIILQYWRQVKTTTGYRLLSCSGNPFAISPVNQRLWKYRLRCTKYYYCVDEIPNDSMMIVGAPPARAFKNFFPEVVLDLRVHIGTPLVDLALECELTCFMMLPVFQGIMPVGVIEVSARHPAHLVVMFNELKQELKRVSLSCSPPFAFMKPCKSIPGDFMLAKSEAANALKVAFESHALTLAQVWTPYEAHRGRMLLGKVKTSCIGKSADKALVSRFYRYFPYLPFKNGEGLAGRTLQTRQSHLCRDIYNLSYNTGILAALSANAKCTTCFVLCLRSSHTGEVDYAFEFFWPKTRNHLVMMEALLLTLREHLPSFKYTSGGQLGDELHVLDVHNPVSPIKISPSETTGMNIDGQSESTDINNPVGEDEDEEDDDDDLNIVAAYKVDCRQFFLPSSTTFEILVENIRHEFELSPADRYKIEYQVLPGEWYGLTDCTSLKSCISSYQASKNIDHIKLHVLPV